MQNRDQPWSHRRQKYHYRGREKIKTVAIVAFPHSGTTMLAGILEIFGVPMVGENYLKGNWEDQDIINSLDRGERSFARLVMERNARYDKWGFKHPGGWRFGQKGAWAYMDLLEKYLRNPAYLTIWKDPMSVTKRYFGYTADPLLLNMQKTCRAMATVLGEINKSGAVVHSLSYTRAIAAPTEFVEHVANISGLVVDEQKLNAAARYIKPNTGRRRAPYPPVQSVRKLCD